MNASTATSPSTFGRIAARALCGAALAGAAFMAAAPLPMDILSMTGERDGRSTAPVTLASATGSPVIEHFRSTAPAELAGEAPSGTSYKRSTAPVSLW